MPKSYRFGLRMRGDEEAACEVLQETLLAAFRHLPGFRGDAALSTWLYQIARSFCIKERRGVRPMTSIDDASDAALVDPAPRGDARAHAREIGGALSWAILALPPDQREALVLRDVEGLSADEAAEIAGVDVGALKSRLHRARMAVRGNVAAWLEGGDAEPCPELAQQLTSYAGAEIDQSACEKIEQHLATCGRCTAACDALKRTVSANGSPVMPCPQTCGARCAPRSKRRSRASGRTASGSPCRGRRRSHHPPPCTGTARPPERDRALARHGLRSRPSSGACTCYT